MDLLDRCRELSDEQLDREFDIGPRSVRATLIHIVRNVEVWTDLIAGQPIRQAGDDALDELSGRLARAATELALVAGDVADRGAWDELWTDVLDEPATQKTYGGAIVHVATHGMHHRAQLLYMLRRLGLEGLPEGDALGWERQLS